MKNTKLYIALFLILLLSIFSYAESLRISQVDNSSLLLNQLVKVYISVTDNNGKPVKDLNKDNIQIFEQSSSYSEKAKQLEDFLQGANVNHGINMLLVVDNSGSMYWDASGKIKNSKNESIYRITYAKKAILSLIDKIKNPKDKIGLLVFNVKVQEMIRPTKDKIKIVQSIENISKPVSGEGYTELNESLSAAIESIQSLKGRKVIIVLSDGKNYIKKDNENFPERTGLEGMLEQSQREGVSVFTIGFTKEADNRGLAKIARETGGAHFSAYSPGELSRLYGLIREQILNEYLLTYKADMIPNEKKKVTVVYDFNQNILKAERYYYSATVFGYPLKEMNYLLFLIIPGCLLLLWLLSLINFEQRNSKTSLQLQTVAGKNVLKQTIAFDESKPALTIGATDKADMTIMGDPKIASNEVTIAKDETKGGYTIVSSGSPVTINNQSVRTKVLRSGDLIKIGNSTIVFDEGAMEKKGKKK